MFSNKYTAGMLCMFLFIISFNQKIQAKSVYVINNIDTSQLRVYEIDDANLVYQTDYNCGTNGAVGLAIDESEYGDFLFVTFEFTPAKIEIIDAQMMQYVDTVTNTGGASNLAGR
jgi:hypothetical protein